MTTMLVRLLCGRGLPDYYADITCPITMRTWVNRLLCGHGLINYYADTRPAYSLDVDSTILVKHCLSWLISVPTHMVRSVRTHLMAKCKELIIWSDSINEKEKKRKTRTFGGKFIKLNLALNLVTR